MAEAHAKHHDYHLVNPSPGRWSARCGASAMALGAIVWMKGAAAACRVTALAVRRRLAGVLYTMVAWWRDVIKEAHQGDHTPVVQLHLRYGMILFIASEVMFFVAWFWAFFDVALFPADVHHVDATRSAQWPHGHGRDTGRRHGRRDVFDPWQLPLVNTLILLTSGTTVTWAHHALLQDDRAGLKSGLC